MQTCADNNAGSLIWVVAFPDYCHKEMVSKKRYSG